MNQQVAQDSLGTLLVALDCDLELVLARLLVQFLELAVVEPAAEFVGSAVVGAVVVASVVGAQAAGESVVANWDWAAVEPVADGSAAEDVDLAVEGEQGPVHSDWPESTRHFDNGDKRAAVQHVEVTPGKHHDNSDTETAGSATAEEQAAEEQAAELEPAVAGVQVAEERQETAGIAVTVLVFDS